MTPSNNISLNPAITLDELLRNGNQDAYAQLYKARIEQDVHNIVLAQDPEGGVIAVKDNFLTTKMITTASSRLLDTFYPPYESTVTKKLHEAGLTISSKTNMDAWAHGSSTETSDFGTTLNPRNPKHLPGGSSGGSAAAVAADLCAAAIGSETAGSIRQPSAWCGVVGLKPTYGRVSRAGVVAMGSSLDCPGPITKTVKDAALLLKIIAGHDPYDATSSTLPVPDFTDNLEQLPKQLRIGVCYLDHPDLQRSPVIQATRDAATILSHLGASVTELPLSSDGRVGTILDPSYAIAVYTVVQRAEVASNLNRYDGVRYGHDRSFFGPEAKRRILLGTFTLSAGYADQYYRKAEEVRQLYRENFNRLFEQFDLLISPTSPGFALPLGATKGNPMFGELEDMLLEPSSISGLPGLSVPMYRDPSTNLYLGLNLVANHFQEKLLLQAGYAYEQATTWNSWLTPITSNPKEQDDTI